MNRNNLTANYTEMSVNSASPQKLVVLLYEGAIRFLRQAASDIDARNLEQKRQSVDRSMAIIQHLQNTLDMDRGGGIATELDNFYSYIISRIMESSAKLDAQPINEAVKLLAVVLTAWEQVAGTNFQSHAPAALVNVASSGQRLQLHG